MTDPITRPGINPKTIDIVTSVEFNVELRKGLYLAYLYRIANERIDTKYSSPYDSTR